ncbi:MAG: SRPBCC domain-containing protein [Pseudonocardia sp.]|nr:SRPBCC domain-containing protein [Pseudonocardia sp.]
MVMRLEFHPEGEKQTRLELRQGPLPVEILDGATLGWESSWTKLDALVSA